MTSAWKEITVVTSSEASEAIAGAFYNTGVKGVSILDSEEIRAMSEQKGNWDYFEEQLISPENEAIIKGYYKVDDERFEEYLEYIKNQVNSLDEFGFDKGKAIVDVNEVKEEDWANNWKKYYKTTKIGERVVIKPVWEEYETQGDEVVVEMDPGMSFGTGTHETTRLCSMGLEEYMKKGDLVFDIGTGSGILSIIASKLGADKVIGVDIDQVAVDAAKENVEYNKCENVDILKGDLMDHVSGKADIVIANIMADIVIFLTDTVSNFVKDGGYFISSGIIEEKRDEVIEALKKNNFEVVEVKQERHWVSIIAKK